LIVKTKELLIQTVPSCEPEFIIVREVEILHE